MEVGDVYQVDFTGRHALRVSVSRLMYPSDVSECLQVLVDAYTKAAEDLLISPGDSEAETANGNFVGIYLLEKDEGGE